MQGAEFDGGSAHLHMQETKVAESPPSTGDSIDGERRREWLMAPAAKF